jgi:hypothetical protein
MFPALLNPSCWKRKSVPENRLAGGRCRLILAAMAIAAIIILLPLKTTDIELWSVDKQTGRYEYMTRVKERDIRLKKRWRTHWQHTMSDSARDIIISPFSVIMTTYSYLTATA